MKSKHKLNKFVVKEYFFNWVNQMRDFDEPDVLAEKHNHICNRFKNFVRNFKILYIKGHPLLFLNKNLCFQLNNEKDILECR